MEQIKATTILCVKKNNEVSISGDGQVSFGDSILKSSAKKVRKVYKNQILAGFAGATADAITLFDKFEAKLEEFKGNLRRSSVELAKEWRTDRVLRRLEAMMIVADRNEIFLISGSGDVIEPDIPICAVGSGGFFAFSAAKALFKFSDLKASEITKESLKIASEVCIYTNDSISTEVLRLGDNT
tara:strand:- start:124582 stop:125133 length:552 start_codon:yes stop_codon:yes gene_type:complete